MSKSKQASRIIKSFEELGKILGYPLKEEKPKPIKMNKPTRKQN